MFDIVKMFLESLPVTATVRLGIIGLCIVYMSINHTLLSIKHDLDALRETSQTMQQQVMDDHADLSLVMDSLFIHRRSAASN